MTKLILIFALISILKIDVFSQEYNLNQYEKIFFGMLEVKCDNRIVLTENYDYTIDYVKKTLKITNSYYSDCPLDIRIKENGLYKYRKGGNFDIKYFSSWKLASIPKYQNSLFTEAVYSNHLLSNYNRAKLSWYTIDPVLVRHQSETPEHLKNNPDEQSYHSVRELYEKDVFPDNESPNNIPSTIQTLNIAFYPNEKGQNNYCYRSEYNQDSTLISAGIDSVGNLLQASTRWSGIMREIRMNDFEHLKIDRLEFILMDPFADDTNFNIIRNDTKPYLYFNIGLISEDVLYDNKQSREQTLLCSGNNDTSTFAIIGNYNNQVPAFSNHTGRGCQDLGYDGLNSEDENEFFSDYINNIWLRFGYYSIAYQQAVKDPSNDDYHYFRGADYDNLQLSIIDRYKNYNLSENNSPTSYMSPEPYPTSATMSPSTEDLNLNNILDTTEAYFQYKISLKPEDFKIGKNHIVDTVINKFTFVNGTESQVTFYKFQIDLNNYDSKHGEINDLSNVSGIRMFLKGLSNQTFLRFISLDLTRTKDLKYFGDIENNELLIFPNPNRGSFNISSKDEISNIEIYSNTGQKIFYTMNHRMYSSTGSKDNMYFVDIKQKLNPGIYLMKLFLGDRTLAKKIIIQ